MEDKHATSSSSSPVHEVLPSCHHHHNTGHDDNVDKSNAVERGETEITKEINILRVLTLVLLVMLAGGASSGIYLYASHYETQSFHDSVATHSQLLIASVSHVMEQQLGGVSALADIITAHAVSSSNNKTFPFVTVPHYAVHASHARVSSGALAIHYMPLVTDDTLSAWEAYALEHRFHINEAFEEDARLRHEQDEVFLAWGDDQHGKVNGETDKQQQRRQHDPRRFLRSEQKGDNETILEDGTGYHPKIFHNAVREGYRGDELEGAGPFFPLWQTSPVNAQKQHLLNFNFASGSAFDGMIEKLSATKEAILDKALFPGLNERNMLEANLKISQYRSDMESYLEDPLIFLAYPVFDSFEGGRKLAGALAANIYWRFLFANILPEDVTGYICVLANSYNQTMVYRVDGKDATFIGDVYTRDERYDDLESFVDLNEYLAHNVDMSIRSYTTVPLNDQFGRHTLRIYPSRETENSFVSNDPILYASVVFLVILMTTAVLVILDQRVAKRQQIIMRRLVKAAEEKTAFERELNTFLAHEVRNPVAAALTANSFVASFVKTLPPSKNNTAVVNPAMIQDCISDVKIVDSSLTFINDFLRSTLDMHASVENKLVIHCGPTDLMKDVLEPVRSILFHQQGGRVHVTVEGPENLLVSTDCLRLKQVMMNLGRNSVKFTTDGFIRLRAALVDGLVELCVEDSGPGIPQEKRCQIFLKFQSSLDVLSQGTGIGLSLSKNLVDLMGGSIFLDENYNSGISGSPGTRFVVQLKNPPLEEEDAMLPPPMAMASIEACSHGAHAIAFDEDSAASENAGLTTLPENLHILFVDDDNVLRRLFVRSVRKVAPSWNISEAASGEAALDLVSATKRPKNYFDIVFMDQYMASTDRQLLGTEAVRELRLRGVESIICGLSANDMEIDFLQAGANAFLLKPLPCNQEALERKLIRIVSQKNPTASANDPHQEFIA